MSDTAERAVVAAAMLHGFTDPQLRRGHFTSARLGWLWAATQSLIAEHTECEPVALERWLRNEGVWSQVGGLDALLEAQDDYRLATSPRQSSQCVLEWHERRKLLKSLENASKLIADENIASDELRAPLSDLATLLRGEYQTATEKRLCDLSDVVDATLEDVSRRLESMNVTISTGLHVVDNDLGGLECGTVCVVGARPGMGKSAFAMTCAVNAAKQGTPALFISLEMSKLQLGRRYLSSTTATNLLALRAPRKYLIDVTGLRRKVRRDIPLYFTDGALDIGTMRALTEAWCSRQGSVPKLVVVDYLQLVDGDRSRVREQEIARLSRELKLLALQENIVVLLLSQLNRAVEQRDDKRPILADLRESGAIEQDADSIIMLHRPWVYDTAEPESLVLARLVKSREGASGIERELHFHAQHTLFTNASELVVAREGDVAL